VTPAYEVEGSHFEIRNTTVPLKWIYRLEPIAAATALIAAFPVGIVIGAVIMILARRSPLIRHERVGRWGAPLRMLKFRTMWESNQKSGPYKLVEDIRAAPDGLKDEDDPRVTSAFAAFCRRYSLDEIPQLYHVARGEMSLVGPRPITSEELSQHYGSQAAEVLQLRPGITGLWQSMGRNRLSYARRKKLDILFVRRASPALYFQVLGRTVPKVLFGYDAF
jgi:lipopolysaccharide/colanic/teichoic acid biosynthesis glycosyltransferase